MSNKHKMNGVNKTLYIPLYGKAYVSRKFLFLSDRKAEEIWEAEHFPLKGKSKSKWLAYYMGIRAAVFDSWLKEQIVNAEDTAVIHIGCGMDSRVLRVGTNGLMWYDMDFPDVIEERKRYYSESKNYKMLSGDLRDPRWLSVISECKKAIIVMEGVSMYLAPEELKTAFEAIGNRFDEVSLLADCYTVFAAKMSKYKNPINDVGVTSVYGVDDPCMLQAGSIRYVKEHVMTPTQYVNELKGVEKLIFSKIYGGSMSKKLYRLYEYRKNM